MQQAQTDLTPTQADTADARLQVLFQAVTALGADLQSFIEGQEVIKPQAAVQRTRQKKGPCCKFCGNIGHIIKVCQEAEKYVCIGKCKWDVSGRVVLPSGANIPYATNCKTLRQHCDEYHQQKPSLQAGMIRLHQDDVASWQNLGPQESRQVTPVRPSPTPLTPREVSVRPGQQTEQWSAVLLTARQAASQVQPQHLPAASVAAAQTLSADPTVSDTAEEFSVLCTIFPISDMSSSQMHSEA